jgi:hypothetical protein
MDLYDTAHSLVQSQRWKLYLTQDEGRVFQFMVETRSQFDSFMSQPIKLITNDSLSGIGDLLDIFDQEQQEQKAYDIISRILLMIVEQRIQVIYPLDPFMAKKIHSLAHEIENKGEDQIEENSADDLDHLKPIEDMYYSLEHDAELIPKLEMFREEEVVVEMDKEDIGDETVQESIEEPIDAPNGLKVIIP